MVNFPSALVLLVLALAGAMGPTRGITAAARSLATSPATQELRPDDGTRDAGWWQAVRSDAIRPVRSSVARRDGNIDRRERTSNADQAWIPIAFGASFASPNAGVVLHARAWALRAPGLPAPSSRAPPLV